LKKWSFWEKGKISQKKFLWGFGGVAVAILIYYFGIVPLIDAKKRADEEISLKQKILLKYAEVIQNRPTFEEALERTRKKDEEIEKRLLPGETPQLGGAHLQDIVKRLSDKNGVGLRSFRILEAKEVGVYRKISLQIDFNPISSMMSLSQFINDLENQEKKLMISEMDLLVFNPRLPNNIQGNLVISGLMKGSKFKEKGRG
jgi:Type II secretion system (T2SS), protein M subtype b